jgi:hypothetical protein
MYSEIVSAAPLAYGGSLKPQPQLNSVPKLDEVSKESQPFLSSRGDENSDNRRPTDPFFYPTTVCPLTGVGLNAIEQGTPPKRDSYPVRPQGGSARAQGDAALFANAPLQSFLDQPEDMRALQEQEDSLARQIQELEHAKSLAAVQSAQALQKIRGRQEQLRREAQQALQRSKEMQAEFALPSFESITGASTVPAKPDPQELAAELPLHNAGLAEQPHWDQEIWSNPPQHSVSSSPDRKVSGPGEQLAGAGIAHERAGSVTSSRQCIQTNSLRLAIRRHCGHGESHPLLTQCTFYIQHAQLCRQPDASDAYRRAVRGCYGKPIGSDARAGVAKYQR